MFGGSSGGAHLPSTEGQKHFGFSLFLSRDDSSLFVFYFTFVWHLIPFPFLSSRVFVFAKDHFHIFSKSGAFVYYVWYSYQLPSLVTLPIDNLGPIY